MAQGTESSITRPILSGKSRQKEAIKLNRFILERNIVVSEEMVKLLEERMIFTHSMMQEIKGAKSRQEKVSKMVDLMSLRGITAVNGFVDVLRLTGHEILAELLQDESIGNLKIDVSDQLALLPTRLVSLERSLKAFEKKDLKEYVQEKVRCQLLKEKWHDIDSNKVQEMKSRHSIIEQNWRHSSDMKTKLKIIDTLENKVSELEATNAEKEKEILRLKDVQINMKYKMQNDLEKQLNFNMANDKAIQRLQARIDTQDNVLIILDNKIIEYGIGNEDKISSQRTLESRFESFLVRVTELGTIERKYQQVLVDRNDLLKCLSPNVPSLKTEDLNHVKLRDLILNEIKKRDDEIAQLTAECGKLRGTIQTLNQTNEHLVKDYEPLRIRAVELEMALQQQQATDSDDSDSDSSSYKQKHTSRRSFRENAISDPRVVELQSEIKQLKDLIEDRNDTIEYLEKEIANLLDDSNPIERRRSSASKIYLKNNDFSSNTLYNEQSGEADISISKDDTNKSSAIPADSKTLTAPKKARKPQSHILGYGAPVSMTQVPQVTQSKSPSNIQDNDSSETLLEQKKLTDSSDYDEAIAPVSRTHISQSTCKTLSHIQDEGSSEQLLEQKQVSNKNYNKSNAPVPMTEESRSKSPLHFQDNCSSEPILKQKQIASSLDYDEFSAPASMTQVSHGKSQSNISSSEQLFYDKSIASVSKTQVPHGSKSLSDIQDNSSFEQLLQQKQVASTSDTFDVNKKIMERSNSGSSINSYRSSRTSRQDSGGSRSTSRQGNWSYSNLSSHSGFIKSMETSPISLSENSEDERENSSDKKLENIPDINSFGKSYIHTTEAGSVVLKSNADRNQGQSTDKVNEEDEYENEIRTNKNPSSQSHAINDSVLSSPNNRYFSQPFVNNKTISRPNSYSESVQKSNSRNTTDNAASQLNTQSLRSSRSLPNLVKNPYSKSRKNRSSLNENSTNSLDNAGKESRLKSDLSKSSSSLPPIDSDNKIISKKEGSSQVEKLQSHNDHNSNYMIGIGEIRGSSAGLRKRVKTTLDVSNEVARTWDGTLPSIYKIKMK